MKALALYSISEEDLISAVAQQDCRPQISIQFNTPKAFDFMMDPGCSLPNAKRENLAGLPVKGLLKEYGSKASICIAGKKKKNSILSVNIFTETVA